MKKLLVLLLSNTLCFNNAVLSVWTETDDSYSTDKPTEIVGTGAEDGISQDPNSVADDPDFTNTESGAPLEEDIETV